MRAAGYFRVSDEDQIDGYSLDAQLRAFVEFCRQKGWEVAETYSEEGRSAWVESIGKRPAFRRMLDDARARKFDLVVTHTLDRFSRNLRVMLEAFHIFARNDVTYVSITQEIDYSKPEGRLFMTMLGAFAQYFSDALSGHTKKGMKERAQQGLFNGEPPFGYERCDSECIGFDDGHTGCHVVSEKAAKVVKVFERYATGTESMSTLADWLNRQGCRTNGKRRAEVLGDLVEVGGRLFTRWSLRDILKNPFYVGKIRYKDEIFEGMHQGIVPRELFDAVQERMSKNRSRRAVSVSHKSDNPHLLTGLLRCHECGTTLWSQNQGSRAGTYYKSPNKGADTGCAHRGKSFVGRPFDEQTNLLFGEFRLREDWIEWVLKNQMTESDTAAVLKRRENIEGRMERARKLYLEGDLTWQRFLKIKEEAEGLLATTYLPEFDDAVEAGKILRDFGTFWGAASVARRNRLLRTMLHAIYADLGEKRVVGLAPKDAFFTPILAMAERDNVTVVPGEEIVLDGKVETGESRTPRPEGAAGGCATGLSGALLSPLPAFAG